MQICSLSFGIKVYISISSKKYSSKNAPTVFHVDYCMPDIVIASDIFIIIFYPCVIYDFLFIGRTNTPSSYIAYKYILSI